MLDFFLKPFRSSEPKVSADLINLKGDLRVGFIVFTKQPISLDSFKATVCDELVVLSGKRTDYSSRNFPISTIKIDDKDNINTIVDMAIRSSHADIIVTLAADTLKKNTKQINRALTEILNEQYSMVIFDRTADGNESPEKVLQRMNGFGRVFNKQDYLNAEIDSSKHIMPQLNSYFAEKKLSVRSLICNNLFAFDPLVEDRGRFNKEIKEFYKTYQKNKTRSFFYESDELNGRLIELSQIVKNYGATNPFYWIILVSSIATSIIPVAYMGYKRFNKAIKSNSHKPKK